MSARRDPTRERAIRARLSLHSQSLCRFGQADLDNLGAQHKWLSDSLLRRSHDAVGIEQGSPAVAEKRVSATPDASMLGTRQFRFEHGTRNRIRENSGARCEAAA
jgi:hypothetical protein